LAPLARAQEGVTIQSRRKAILEGTHAFRRVLFDRGLTPLESFDSLVDEPRRNILIVLGDLEVINRIPGGLQKFVKEGGAVLLARSGRIGCSAAAGAWVRGGSWSSRITASSSTR